MKNLPSGRLLVVNSRKRKEWSALADDFRTSLLEAG